MNHTRRTFLTLLLVLVGMSAGAGPPVTNVAGYPCEGLSKSGLVTWIRATSAGEEVGTFMTQVSGRVPGWYAQELYSQAALSEGRTLPSPEVMASFGRQPTVPIPTVRAAIRSTIGTFGLGAVLGFAMDYGEAISPTPFGCAAKGMLYEEPLPPVKPKGQCIPKSTFRGMGVTALQDKDGDGYCDDERDTAAVLCDDGTQAPDGNKDNCPKAPDDENSGGCPTGEHRDQTGECVPNGPRGPRNPDGSDGQTGYPGAGVGPCHWVYLGDVACTVFGLVQDCMDEVRVCPGGGGGERRRVPYAF